MLRSARHQERGLGAHVRAARDHRLLAKGGVARGAIAAPRQDQWQADLAAGRVAAGEAHLAWRRKADDALLRSGEYLWVVFTYDQIALEVVDAFDLGVTRSGLLIHSNECHRDENDDDNLLMMDPPANGVVETSNYQSNLSSSSSSL